MPVKKKRVQLTANFYLDEWDCKDGTPVPKEYIPNALLCAQNLQVLRDDINIHNRPKIAPKGVQIAITIISGYRTPEHNKRVKGKRASKHLISLAADIVCRYVSPSQMAARIERLINAKKMKQGGIENYPGFTHYDPRGWKARW